MRRCLTISTIFGASMFLAPDLYAACEPFEAHSPSSEREAHSADRGEEGASAGDKILGRRGLYSANRTPIGEFFWLGDIQAVDAEGTSTSRLLNAVYSMDDGAIFAIIEAEHPHDHVDHGQTSGLAPSFSTVANIVGGTGAYAGAEGTITHEGEGNDIRFRFDIACE